MQIRKHITLNLNFWHITHSGCIPAFCNILRNVYGISLNWNQSFSPTLQNCPNWEVTNNSLKIDNLMQFMFFLQLWWQQKFLSKRKQMGYIGKLAWMPNFLSIHVLVTHISSSPKSHLFGYRLSKCLGALAKLYGTTGRVQECHSFMY